MPTGRSPVATTPGGPAWFAASTSDGACHYGKRDNDGLVRAVCGVEFTPVRNPYTNEVACWRRPVDETHGCSDCGDIAGK